MNDRLIWEMCKSELNPNMVSGTAVQNVVTPILPANPMRYALWLGMNFATGLRWWLGDEQPTIPLINANTVGSPLIFRWEDLGDFVTQKVWMMGTSVSPQFSCLELSFCPKYFDLLRRAFYRELSNI